MITWRKSTRCGGSATCVEVARWRKSRACQASNGCVEVGTSQDAVAVRNSTDPDGPLLLLSADAWRSLLTDIKEEC